MSSLSTIMERAAARSRGAGSKEPAMVPLSHGLLSPQPIDNCVAGRNVQSSRRRDVNVRPLCLLFNDDKYYYWLYLIWCSFTDWVSSGHRCRRAQSIAHLIGSTAINADLCEQVCLLWWADYGCGKFNGCLPGRADRFTLHTVVVVCPRRSFPFTT